VLGDDVLAEDDGVMNVNIMRSDCIPARCVHV
jgi:hypothetical protein